GFDLDIPDTSVAILLGSHNGGRFIAEQLESIAAQSHRNWSLWVSDDNSSDDTLEKVQRFANDGWRDRVHILKGPARGFVANFLSLACNPDIEANYFAFCDQDDIWVPQKLETALRKLSHHPAKQPAAYLGRTELIDSAGKTIGLSPLFPREPTLKNALVQSVGGGNTMVINAAARQVLCMSGDRINVASHDWWTYLCVSACGGVVIYDPTPMVKYRQHGSNIIGENSSLMSRLLRANLLLRGRFSSWIEGNMTALENLEAMIPAPNRDTISTFKALRCRPNPIGRLIGLYQLGLYRQRLFDNIWLYLAAALGKW
ncbi:MAG: glycosyltransferase family 2 protein, partial [Rhizobiales bacterium]|nr:glycosyltransferase family 2 protein [Hyphomicrobiales bacterium]